MRTSITVLLLLLVQGSTASAQYFGPPAGRMILPPHPALIRPSSPYTAQHGLFAPAGPRVVLSTGTGTPTVGQNYNSLINNLPALMAYSRMAQRSSTPYPYPKPGETNEQIHASSAINRNDRPLLPGGEKAAAVSLNSAKEAFRDGKYFQAVGFANWAVMENPADPINHEFYSLAMFAQGDYHGASLAAHAMLHSGRAASWPAVAAWYVNPATYHDQLRALETRFEERPEEPAAAFLLGYHYSMLGRTAEAIGQLQTAVKLSPEDVEARTLLADLEQQVTGANSTINIPRP